MFVPDFDVIHGFPPDYMHGVLLGVMKMMWDFFTCTSNHQKPFYVGLQLKEVEKRMISIRPPSAFPRYPGKLEDIKKNKATDWEHILYHYFFPCFYGILPQPFLDHFMLLSSSVFNLLDLHLSPEKIDSCETSINSFVAQFEKFYGENNMVFNVHLLTHLSQCARNFGALWNSSLYPYESANGMILNYRTGNNHPVVQITKKYVMHRICQNSRIPETSPAYTWHSEIWNSTKKQDLHFDRRFVYELSQDVSIDDYIEQREFSYHDRIHVGNIQYRTHKSCRDLGYDDSYVCIYGEFFRIEQILTDTNSETYIVGLKLITCKLFDNMFTYSISDSMLKTEMSSHDD
ncbi:uncharacterized protein LOC134218809 [Armigeres subalbatus]|uniref:uncharacterized protein LOC134218809 n=1 Tax=Armigeres subalbatus TaxID=124917 RepID=UPI002ED1140F